MYLAGLLLATGASLALAGPAAAAGSTSKCDHPDHSYGFSGDHDGDYYSNRSYEWHSSKKNSDNHTSGLIVLGGNNGDRYTNNGFLGLGPLF
jgi:hypothetical protein